MVTKEFNGVKVDFHMSEKECTETSLIYIIKFDNGLYYVGQTQCYLGLINRIRNHCESAIKKRKGCNTLKANIINKFRHFSVFILRKCRDMKELDEMEMFYISILKRKLVNIESGGHENKILSVEHKEKIKNGIINFYKKNGKTSVIDVYDLYGKLVYTFNHSLEAAAFFNKKRQYLYRLCRENILLDKKYQLKYRNDTSKEINDLTNKITANGNVGKSKHTFILPNNEKILSDKVFCYNENGVYVNEYKIHELERRKISSIKQAIRHNTFLKNNFWSVYKKEKIDVPLLRYEKASVTHGKKIYQLDDNLNIIHEWCSINKAAKIIGTYAPNIASVCKRKKRHCAGYVWCYKNEYEWFKENWDKPLLK